MGSFSVVRAIRGEPPEWWDDGCQTVGLDLDFSSVRCNVVKDRLLQYFGCLRGRSCVTILAFLMLPYLVDVAYYGDFTLTHYAQENSIEGETDNLSDVQMPDGGDQEQTLKIETSLKGALTILRSTLPIVFPPKYLLAHPHTSRPPPAI